MSSPTIHTYLRAAVVCISVSFSSAAFPHGGMMMGGGEMPRAYAIQFLAWMTAFGEMCETKFPEMKDAISASWVKGLDAHTLEWEKKIKESPEFDGVLADTRKQMLPRTDELSKECKQKYGNQGAPNTVGEHHHHP